MVRGCPLPSVLELAARLGQALVLELGQALVFGRESETPLGLEVVAALRTPRLRKFPPEAQSMRARGKT